MMAGVKGRSGGYRPGAGAKPKPRPEPVLHECADADMLEFLQGIALGRIDATPTQLRAAIAAVQYTHTKRADGGKKEEQADKAKKAAGKFAASAPPLKLIAK